LIEELDIAVQVSVNTDRHEVLHEFEDFATRIIQLSGSQTTVKVQARIHRVGVTNAADRGLDMWANFGLAIQIKHLSLTEELAENIVSSVCADRIVIVCKDTEQKIILSMLTQIGWKSRIQSIITETDLIAWYDKALKGKYSERIGDNLLKKLTDELEIEFPSTSNTLFSDFMKERGYDKISDAKWIIS